MIDHRHPISHSFDFVEQVRREQHRASLFSLLSLVAGGATLEEIMPILQERERQCELARRSAAQRRDQAAAAKHD